MTHQLSFTLIDTGMIATAHLHAGRADHSLNTASRYRDNPVVDAQE